MANISALNTLIELATKDVEDAATLLGRAVRAVADAKEKLTLLSGYQEDYANRFQSSMAGGLTTMAYRNFRAFMDKLDQAIAGQRHVITDAECRAEIECGKWRECERKRISYDALASRAKSAEQKKVAKREQKETDELAARKLTYER